MNTKKIIFGLTLLLSVLLLFNCSSSPEVSVCDCINKRGYADSDGKYYKPCNKKFKEIFGTTNPSSEQMINYTLKNCCQSFPDECERLRNTGY